MVNFFLDSIIYILAIYGIINLIKEVIFNIKYKNEIDSIKHYIYVKDAEDIIEIYIRDILFKYPNLKNITIIDENSKDNTYKILEKIKSEYDYINIVKSET